MKVWETFTNQQQWKDYLHGLLKTNDRALLRAIWVIYARQTVEEQIYGVSTEENGRGFSKIDAEFFTELVVQMQHGRELSPRQMAIARNKITKYWRQLMEESKEKMEREERDAESRRKDIKSTDI